MMRELLRLIRLRLRTLLRRRQLERDLEDELAYHLELRQARGSAPVPFGNITSIREECRDLWTWTWLEDFCRDFRHAGRTLCRSAGHTLGIVLLLALGMGGTTAIFSLFRAVLVRDLPVSHPEDLVILKRLNERGQLDAWSQPLFEDFRRMHSGFRGLIAIGTLGNAAVSLSPGAVELPDVTGYLASGNYFEVLGVRAELGRVLADADDEDGNPQPVAVLAYDFWQTRFGGDPTAVGRKLFLYGRPFTIIGVAQRGFAGESPGYATDFWVPLNTQPVARPGPDVRRNRAAFRYFVMGRLKAGVTIRRAQAESDVLYRRIQEEQATAQPNLPPRPGSTRIEPGSQGRDFFRNQFGRPLQVLLAAGLLLLLLASSNAGSLLLARASARQREIAIRQSLGCGKARLARQFLMESSLLAICASTLGLAITAPLARALVALASIGGVPFVLDVAPDRGVLLFTLGITAAVALLCGILPACRAAQVRSDSALALASRAVTGSRYRYRASRFLIALQVALSVVLVTGASLFEESLIRLYRLNPGFDRRHVLAVTVDARFAGYQKPEQYESLAQQITAGIATLPGVRSISVAGCGLLSGCSQGVSTFQVEDNDTPPGRRVLRVNLASRNFFSTVGMSLVEGRSFDAGDRLGTPRVAIVNETFARFYFRGRSALGRRIWFDNNRSLPIQIVGVVRDSKLNDLREITEPIAFLAFEQTPNSFNAVLLKTEGAPLGLIPAVRQSMLGVDSKLRLRFQTLDDALDRSLSHDILLARLGNIFGALALLLACFGVYGAISYFVAAQTAELGIRLAIGAQPPRVLREVVSGALRTVAPGLLLGLGAAWASGKLAHSLLFGITGRDPGTYLGVSVGLLAATACAAYLPARRASRIDPASALRCD